MPPTVSQRFVATLALLVVLALPAAADSYTFRHSPNGKRAHSEHIEAIAQHKARFMLAHKTAGSRFVQMSERHVKRYTTALNREVRTLTRAGEIKPAYAVRDLANRTEDWEIEPPDEKGFHFLHQADLSAEGSDKANQLGVDLTVEIEKAGVVYSEQLEAAYEQYVSDVANSRAELVKALKRVVNIEQEAGRLEALTEVTDAVEVFKNLPDPPRPIEPKKDLHEKQPADTRPDEREPNNRPEIFEGLHDDDDHQPGTTPKPLSKDNDTPWAGYHLLKYSMNGRHGVEFLVKLDTAGGTLLMTARQSQGNDRVNHNIPIEIISQNDEIVLFKHKSDIADSTTIHLIELVNGQPRLCKAWWSVSNYTAKQDPSQAGQVFRLGNPDADLLGLSAGVYLAKMAQTRNKSNRQEIKTIQFEITVDAGHVMISRHNKSDKDNGWSEWHAFMLVVKTEGNELMMTYDRDEFDWHDLFVIDMSDKTQPVLKHWWRGDWRPRGDQPSAVGKLIKQ